MIKYFPNIISALRILGAICLLSLNPVNVAFWVIYGLCGISDMLDGYLARKQLQMPNSFKAWLAYCSDNLRRMNRKNMKLIGIPEEEVLAFTDARAEVAVEEEPLPDYSDFMKPHPDKESIDANLDYAR